MLVYKKYIMIVFVNNHRLKHTHKYNYKFLVQAWVELNKYYILT
jgi:hypothetical protein